MNYRPKPDSVSGRAVAWLQERAPHGGGVWIGARQLAQALGIPGQALHNGIYQAVNADWICKRIDPIGHYYAEFQAGPMAQAPAQEARMPANAPTFREGGPAHLAYQALQEKSPLSLEALAVVLDRPAHEVLEQLRFPCSMGYMRREAKDDGVWFHLGTATPVAAANDDGKLKPKEGSGSRVTHLHRGLPDPRPAPPMPAVAPPRVEPAANDMEEAMAAVSEPDDKPVYTYDSRGRLAVAKGGKCLVLEGDEVLDLLEFVGKFAARAA